MRDRIEEGSAKIPEVWRGWLGDNELTKSVERRREETLACDALQSTGDGINEDGETGW